MRLEFDHLPDGTTLNDRSHWAVHKRATDAAHALVRDAVGPLPAQPLDRSMLLRLHFYLPDNRPRDLDNLIPAAKPYIDALVAANLLRDDGVNCINAIVAD